MRDDLDKAEQRWRSRRLFRPERRPRNRLAVGLLLLAVAILLVATATMGDLSELVNGLKRLPF